MNAFQCLSTIDYHLRVLRNKKTSKEQWEKSRQEVLRVVAQLETIVHHKVYQVELETQK